MGGRVPEDGVVPPFLASVYPLGKEDPGTPLAVLRLLCASVSLKGKGCLFLALSQKILVKLS